MGVAICDYCKARLGSSVLFEALPEASWSFPAKPSIPYGSGTHGTLSKSKRSSKACASVARGVLEAPFSTKDSSTSLERPNLSQRTYCRVCLRYLVL